MNRLKTAALLLAFALLLSPALTLDRGEPVLVANPYRDIDWNNVGQYKANLHAHTTNSDGLVGPAQAIDAYYRLGYKVLALTDHNTLGQAAPTWPWSDYRRCPDQLGMVAVQGNELSQHHHLGSYFCPVADTAGDIVSSLEQIGAQGGLAVFFHPGRYNAPRRWSWYVPYFLHYPFLVGMEVYNQGDRYPSDRALWDNVLTQLMPHRPVWGFSNDDSHTRGQIGRNWNTLLLTSLSEEMVRQAIESGWFYCTYQPGDKVAPVIDAISADTRSITIAARNYRHIVWISEGRIIHTGNTLDYKVTAGVGSYVRAEVRGEGGTALTNPFGFSFVPREQFRP